jgi:hypothetical protein
MTPSNGSRRLRWTGLAAGMLVVVLAACGSQAKQVEVKKKVAPSPRKVLLASVQATTAAKSAHMSMSMETGFGAEHFTITGDGVTDFVTGDTALTMQFPAIGSEAAGTIELRVVDRAGYMKLPDSLGGGRFAGKWFKLPNLGDANNALPGLGQSDPSKFLAYLESVSAGVKKVGSDTIRGVDTTHYAASLDLAKAINRADVPPALRDEIKNLFGRAGAPSAMPADVWVDDNGFARRIKLQLDLGAFMGNAPGAGGKLPSITVSMDLYDFGVPVHVQAPPADQVTELPLGPTGSTGAGAAAA